MKIKKSEYDKNIEDTYWRGVKAGIEFALNNPSLAAEYKDNVPGLKAIVDKLKDAMQCLANALDKIQYNLMCTNKLDYVIITKQKHLGR